MTTNGYTYKNWKVTGVDTNGCLITLTVSATCRWSAILEGRKLGIKETHKAVIV